MIERVKSTNWLDVCWEECEAMTQWVAENYNVIGDFELLKEDWLEDNGYDNIIIEDNCFFCHYAYFSGYCYCNCCPGRSVDAQFSCGNPLYRCEKLPVEFYEKIREMNELRNNQ